MKLKLYTYVHEANGLALQVIPETEPATATGKVTEANV